MKRQRSWAWGLVPAVALMVAGAWLVLPAMAALRPSGAYAVDMVDLDAAALGVRVAQQDASGVRDLHVRLRYPPGAKGPWPILLYFPGWPGDRHDNEGLLADLASHGYLVASVTYVREDRRLDGPMDFSTIPKAENFLWMARNKVSLQARDASAVLDAVLRLDAHDPANRFTGRLDTRHVGILGFSFGGAVAAETCAHDPRFLAALNMDGWLFGDAASLSFTQPYFLISDDDTDPTPAQLGSADPSTRYTAILSAHDFRQIRVRLSRPGGYMITILNTQHESFSDTPLHFGLRNPAMPGPIGAMRVSAITRRYAVAFFGQYLKGEPAPLLASHVSPYPNVRMSLPAPG